MLNPKVAYITPQRTAQLISLKDALAKIPEHDHAALDGLNYLNYKLGIFINVSPHPHQNKLATTLIKYLKRQFTVIDNSPIIYGDVLVYEDNGDMTQEIWKLMTKEISSKKNKEPPQEVEKCITGYRKQLDEVDGLDEVYEPLMRKMITHNIYDANHYGEIVK